MANCDHDPELDGKMTISETESACEIEQDGGFQITDIQFGTKTHDGKVFLINKTCFKEKLSGILKNLHFVEIKDGDNAEKIKKDKEGSGWTHICRTKIYVENEIKDVFVFGKKNF